MPPVAAGCAAGAAPAPAAGASAEGVVALGVAGAAGVLGAVSASKCSGIPYSRYESSIPKGELSYTLTLKRYSTALSGLLKLALKALRT